MVDLRIVNPMARCLLKLFLISVIVGLLQAN